MLEKLKLKQSLQINCFACKSLIKVKYVRRSGNYSQKNNWGFWTEREKYKVRYICDDCLVKLYKQCKWEFKLLINNKKKQVLLRQYILDGDISGKFKTVFMDDEHIDEHIKKCSLREKCFTKKRKEKKEPI